MQVLAYLQRGSHRAVWRANLTQSPDYLPSRLSLAQALAEQGDNAGAMEEYRRVLEAKPDYVAARIALADVLAKTNDRDGALDQLRQVTKQDSLKAIAARVRRLRRVFIAGTFRKLKYCVC